MNKLIIFGLGDIAQIAKYYFKIDSNYQVESFTVDKEYMTADQFEKLPVHPFDAIEEKFPPNEYDMFVGIGYTKMNKFRERKYEEAKLKGYKLVSYVSSKCTYLSQYKPGDNCMIFEDNTIQPFVKIENNVTIWSGNHIGHHSIIKSHNFITSHVVISGHCSIESNCFLGVNSAIGNGVRIASETLLGAGAVVVKDTEEKGVYLAPKPTKISKTSDKINL